MENKQTAVQWLEDEFSKFNDEIQNNREITFNEYHQRRIKLWEQAKAMEKEQIINAYSQGLFGEESTDSISAYAKQYYNETYGK
jgi:hypothetical protein